jgi:putative intracellular protease/amidase
VKLKIVPRVMCGRSYLVIEDEHGAELPMQQQVVVSNGLKENTVTVTFAIDGNAVELVTVPRYADANAFDARAVAAVKDAEARGAL